MLLYSIKLLKKKAIFQLADFLQEAILFVGIDKVIFF